MKELYNGVEFEIIKFRQDDIIVTSENDWKNGSTVPNYEDPDSPIYWNNNG
ncbi:MAG: hypothetical protein IKN17_07280 [Ruminococcus sp.]|nr:hypothetical protein [Ruminococcus sp.]